MTAVQPEPGASTADLSVGVDGVGHFQRSSLFMIFNTLITGVLGIAFWLTAARLYPSHEVGAAVAASSLLIALAYVSQLNLSTSISRFMPGAESAQRSTVRYSYTISLGMSGALAVAVLAVALVRSGRLFPGGDWPLAVVLAVSLPVWTLFALQDSVLISVRRSGWVPVENAATALAKFAILPGLVWIGGGGVILAAWVAPAVPAIIVVTAALRRRFLVPGTDPIADPRHFVRFSLLDFPGTVAYLFSLRIVPLLVTFRSGASEGAFIGLPWTIVTVGALALPALSQALLVELSHAQSDTDRLLRRSLRLILVIAVPGCVVGAVVARPILALAGAAYVTRGGGVLAWGLLGLAPAAVVECALAVLRHADRVVAASGVQAARAGGVLLTVVALIATGRTDLVGAAFLGVNLGFALAVLPILRRRSGCNGYGA